MGYDDLILPAVTATIVAAATHPADLTPDQRRHLGLPADDEPDDPQEPK